MQLAGVERVRRRQQPASEDDRFLIMFGKPARLMSCECERSSETTLSQAFYLISGDGLRQRIAADDNRLQSWLAAGATDVELVDTTILDSTNAPTAIRGIESRCRTSTRRRISCSRSTRSGLGRLEREGVPFSKVTTTGMPRQTHTEPHRNTERHGTHRTSPAALTRRAALRIGGSGLLGLHAATLVACQRALPTIARGPNRSSFLFQWGGPSHLDTFDMKPDAPDGVQKSLPGHVLQRPRDQRLRTPAAHVANHA